MIRLLALILAVLLIGAGFAAAGGVVVADALYEQAVDACEAYGGRPVAVDDRLAYECATSYGRIRP